MRDAPGRRIWKRPSTCGEPRRLWLLDRVLPLDLSVAKQFDLSALKEDSLPEDLDAELLAREPAATHVQQTDGQARTARIGRLSSGGWSERADNDKNERGGRFSNHAL